MIMTETAKNLELRDAISETALHNAWSIISPRSSTPGIDGVTVEDFSRNLAGELENLYRAISTGKYAPSPLLVFPKLKKDNLTFRELTIPTLKDKIAARALSDFIVDKVNTSFAPQSYAYRHGKGAIKAAIAAEHYVKNKTCYAVKIDINDFFNSIDHGILARQLEGIGFSQQTVKLIMSFADNQRFDGVRRYSPGVGVPQGISLAPVLSNIYLDSFDKSLNEGGASFIRYADDILIFANSADEAGNLLNFAIRQLNSLNLTNSIDKTKISNTDEGFIFLGFLFTRMGKTPSNESKKRLNDKLDAGIHADERVSEYGKRRESIIRGWKNYFCNPEKQEQNEENEIAIPAISSEPVEEKSLHVTSTEIRDERPAIIDSNATAAGESPSMQQSGTENTISATQRENTIKESLEQITLLVETERYHTAINRIRFLLNDDSSTIPANLSKDLYAQLASLYGKLGLHGAADSCRVAGGLKPEKITGSTQELVFGTADAQLWMELFHSGLIVYMQFVDRLGRHGYKPATHPLTPQFLHNHWKGEMTLSVPLFDKENTVRFAVIDLDITRKTLDNVRQDEFNKIKQQLLDDARGILDIAFKVGIVGIIEDSGYKGYHVWFFFNERVSGDFAASFLRSLDRRIGKPSEGTHRELFPASAELTPDMLNSRIKLPLGIHKLSGNRSKFLTPEGVESLAPLQLLNSHSILNNPAKVKSAVAFWDKYRNDLSSASVDKSAPADDLSILFSKCSVLNAIRMKAQEKGGLNHYDRIVLRGILSHLGLKGKEEIHRILRYCENYSQALTDEMIASDQYKPIGCQRIREILGDLCANVNCACTFKSRKGMYANPLRHLDLRESSGIKEPPHLTASPSPALNTGNCQPASAPAESPLPTTCKDNNVSKEDCSTKKSFLDFSLILGKLQISIKL